MLQDSVECQPLTISGLLRIQTVTYKGNSERNAEWRALGFRQINAHPSSARSMRPPLAS